MPEAIIPPKKYGGRHRAVDMREIVNPILYVLRTGARGATFRMTFRRGGRCGGGTSGSGAMLGRERV